MPDENPIEDVLEEEGKSLIAGNPLDTISLDPQSVDRLFNAHPLHLSEAQMEVIIATERKAREEFVAKKKAGPKKKRSEVVLPEELATLSVDDLDIKI